MTAKRKNIVSRSRLGSWGGSMAVRIPKAAVDSLGLKEGEDVEISVEAGTMVIRQSNPRYSLAELVRQAKGQEPPPALDDAPVGEELL
jgi:antitoxin MazE